MKFLHNLLKGISFTGALFVFQACYGAPQRPYLEEEMAPMSFTLVSHETGQPLEGIRVMSRNYESKGAYQFDLGTTDAQGHCRVTIPFLLEVEGPYLTFTDPEGQYAVKDTLISDLRERDILIKLDPQE